MIIYKITNIVNSKIYVGQTIGSLYDRWCGHKSETKRGYKYPLYQAFVKYGIDNFTVELLETLPINSTQEDLDNREKWWIATLQTLSPKGYNLDVGGRGRGRFSEETLRKMSLAKIGKKRKPYSKETCQRLSVVNKGKKMSEEAKRNMSKASKGRIPWNKGIPQTEEVKKKISDVKIGKKRGPLSEETKRKLSIANTGKKYKKRLEKL